MFDYHMYGEEIGSLEVLVNGSVKLKISGQQHNEDDHDFTKAIVNLSNYKNKDLQITFRTTTAGQNSGGDIAIDNVSFQEYDAYLVYPNSIKKSYSKAYSASFNWEVENGISNNVQWEVLILDITNGETKLYNTTETNISSTSFIAKNLTSEHDYKFYVRSVTVCDYKSLRRSVFYPL